MARRTTSESPWYVCTRSHQTSTIHRRVSITGICLLLVSRRGQCGPQRFRMALTGGTKLALAAWWLPGWTAGNGKARPRNAESQA